MSEATELYRHFDKKDRLLYIGISKNADKRARQHRNNSEWFVFQHYMTIETHPDRKAALAAEKKAIETEAPPYNKDSPYRDDYEYWYNKLPSVVARKKIKIEEDLEDHKELIDKVNKMKESNLAYWIWYYSSYAGGCDMEPDIEGVTTMRDLFRPQVKLEIIESLGGTMYEEKTDMFVLNGEVMIIKLQDPIYFESY